jgi:hypothetical protein
VSIDIQISNNTVSIMLLFLHAKKMQRKCIQTSSKRLFSSKLFVRYFQLPRCLLVISYPVKIMVSVDHFGSLVYLSYIPIIFLESFLGLIFVAAGTSLCFSTIPNKFFSITLLQSYFVFVPEYLLQDRILKWIP